MGVPLIAFVAGLRLVPGAWMEAIKRVFGVLFLVLAVWMLERFVDATWVMLMLGAIAVGSAVYLGALERLPADATGWRRLWKTVGVLLLAIGLFELVGALGGARDYLQPLKGVFGAGSATHAELPFDTIKSSADLDRELAAAGAAGQPVVLDFYADWCVACKEMEKYTLPKPAVQAELAGFVRLKADVTPNDDVDQALMKRFGIIGPPATLFFACGKDERRELRLIGFEDEAAFVQRLRRARQC
jgi:thiol:disulfide interchange protein DsbD